MTLQIFWPKPGNPRERGQKGGTNGREGGGEGGSRAKPGNQLVHYKNKSGGKWGGPMRSIRQPRNGLSYEPCLLICTHMGRGPRTTNVLPKRWAIFFNEFASNQNEFETPS